MRIIAGRFRSRRLKTVDGLNTRPTPDRLRESLFSVLAPRLDGSLFLDAFAGTGVVGLEALSRGARHVILIEKNAKALAVIRENLQLLGIANEVTVVRGSVATLLANHPCDIAFLDPPYEQEGDYGSALNVLGSSSSCKLAVAQHRSKLVLEEQYGLLNKIRILRQGDNSLSFFEPA
jgi:16S rRNA (guanine966-N2)-methyltransferase